MFAHKKFYGCAGYVDDPLPNIVLHYVALLEFSCILWLSYAFHQYYVVFSGQSFFLFLFLFLFSA